MRFGNVQRVSPGHQPRPSLSGCHYQSSRYDCGVSPGHQPRPSLSVLGLWKVSLNLPGVAGASAPAFVERTRPKTKHLRWRRVAGASAPAFVERDTTRLGSR